MLLIGVDEVSLPDGGFASIPGPEAAIRTGTEAVKNASLAEAFFRPEFAPVQPSPNDPRNAR